MLRQRELAILVLECIDVDGSVRRLRRNVFVHGIPSYTLNVVVVLGNLSYDASSLGVVYTGNVVHTAGDEEDAVWRPGQVVDLRGGAAHGLDPPRLLVLEALFEVVVRGLVLGRDPEQDVAVVAGAGQDLSCGRVRDG